MNYVISDLHGNYIKFIELLRTIKFSNNDKLYILGDCIDRGPDGIKIIQYIMDSTNMEFILGNHEDMFLNYIETQDTTILRQWFGNGGISTYDEYMILDSEEKKKLYNFLKKAPLYKIIDNIILLHAGISIPIGHNECFINEIIERQTREDFLWSREEFYLREGLSDYLIIFGHTPVPFIDAKCKDENGNYIAWHDKVYNDKICIDTGCTFIDGRLCCINIDTMEEIYI